MKETFGMSMLSESAKYFNEYDEYEDDSVGGEKLDYTIEDKYDYILGLMNNLPSDQLKELAGMVCGVAFDPEEDDQVVFAKCAEAMDNLMATQDYDKIKEIFDVVKTDDAPPSDEFVDDEFADGVDDEYVEEDEYTEADMSQWKKTSVGKNGVKNTKIVNGTETPKGKGWEKQSNTDSVLKRAIGESSEIMECASSLLMDYDDYSKLMTE